MKKLNFYLHSFLGRSCALFLIIAAFTGVVLVFEEEINEARHPAYHHVEPLRERLSWGELVSLAYRAFPDHAIGGFQLPTESGQTLRASLFKDGHLSYAFIDPYRGKVLGVDSNPWRLILLRLHYALFLGDWGMAFMFLPAVAMILLGVTGLWVHRNAWKAMLTVPRFKQSPRLGLSDLHKAIGVPLFLFLAVLGFTGAWMNWNAFVRIATGKARPPEIATVDNRSYHPITLDVNQAMITAIGKVPDMGPTFLAAPRDKSSDVRVFGAVPGWWLWGNFATQVAFDNGSGEAKKVEDVRTAPWSRRLVALIGPLHFGNFAGLGLKIVYGLGALALALLVVTGEIIWWQRSRKKSVAVSTT